MRANPQGSPQSSVISPGSGEIADCSARYRGCWQLQGADQGAPKMQSPKTLILGRLTGVQDAAQMRLGDGYPVVVAEV